MPNNRVIAVFCLASGIILYAAYATLLPNPDQPNPAQYAKRTTKINIDR